MEHNKNIEGSEVGWSDTVVMICERCGEQFKSENQQSSPERIKGDLKSIAKSEFEKGTVRVITTSCLNICPENKIAITVASKSAKDIFKAYAVDADISGKDLFEEILKK
ncbi:MAG: hypothetical protein WC635_14605 [Bacteriovorax sp.]|jgi:predicted metal-binding protein